MKTENLLKNVNLKPNKGLLFDILLLLGFIGIGTAGRTILVGWGLQPFPNFEIIMVLTFLAAIFLRPTLAMLVPLFSMILSDILIGNPIFVGSQMNKIVLFTYSGFAMIAVINIFNRNRFKKGLGELKLKNIGIAAGLGMGFVLIFDVWTNVGWWYLIYPHTPNTLTAVFTAGVPFMIYHMISAVFTFVAIALPVVSFVSMEYKFELPRRIKTIHKIPVVAIALALVVMSFTGTAMQVPEKSEVWLENSDETSVKMVIIGNGWRIEDNVVACEGDTVFFTLEKITKRNGLSFKYTPYEQFNSVLVDSIGNDVNGDGDKYWQYYVNDDIPMVGCDQYALSNGDYVEWSFETIAY